MLPDLLIKQRLISDTSPFSTPVMTSTRAIALPLAPVQTPSHALVLTSSSQSRFASGPYRVRLVAIGSVQGLARLQVRHRARRSRLIDQ
jgi:hypothetical protein